ncbi:quinone-dependent dihydroorotate dehydrogenase [Ornithinimicrobium sp. Y1847]|uniref:quinone-dependent dihydroorotate dehydrogenase n=1 Tax=unclassified Ornithinimicrobium TaxID=2615080 RepID=UPI003B67C28A
MAGPHTTSAPRPRATSRFTRDVADTAYRGLVRPALFRADAESAHHGTVVAADLLGRTPVTRALAAVAGYAVGPGQPDPAPVELLGLSFRNRIGLAAGLDKDGRGIATWSALGLGHVELGTVTPRPQPGNQRPRVLRLPRSQAVINRMGFNNHGVHALAERLRHARQEGLVRMPVGVSIGKNKDTPVEEAAADYLACVAALEGLADYLAVNVSSPNTPDLRSLQDAGPLGELIREVVAAAAPTPVLVKLAPDLTDPALDEALDVALEAGAAGIIAVNTTITRDNLAPQDRRRGAAEQGGLSGGPLTLRAREVVARVRARTEMPVIGVGGVLTGSDARALVEAGADLVQLYTGLVYAGPALIGAAVRAADG